MKTQEQREQHFKEELQSLLKRHGAEIVLTDDGKKYGKHSVIALVQMDAIYDDSGSGDLLADHCDFELMRNK